MTPSKLTANRPRFQPGFEPDGWGPDSFEPDITEVEEESHGRKGKISTLHLYVALSAAVTIFWIVMCSVTWQ